MNKILIIFLFLVVGLIGSQLAECKPKESKKATTIESSDLSEEEEEKVEQDLASKNETSPLKPFKLNESSEKIEDSSSSESNEEDDDDDDEVENNETTTAKSKKKHDKNEINKNADSDESASANDLPKYVKQLQKSFKSQEKKFNKKLAALVKENHNQDKKIDLLNLRLTALETSSNGTLTPTEKNKNSDKLSCIKKRDPKKAQLYDSVKFKKSYAEFSKMKNEKECWKKCVADSNCIASSFDASSDFILPFRQTTTATTVVTSPSAPVDDEQEEKEEEVTLANCFLYDCNLAFESYHLGWKTYSLISTGDVMKLDFNRKFNLNDQF